MLRTRNEILAPSHQGKIMFATHASKITKASVLLLSLAACGKPTTREEPQQPQDFDFGIWFAGDPIRSWFIANGSYESNCQGGAAGNYDSRSSKFIYTFNGSQLAVEQQGFEDESCSRPLFVRTLQGRPDLIQKAEGGRLLYFMYEDVELTVHRIHLKAEDVDLLIRYDVPGEWVPESLNSIVHLKEDLVKNKFDAIPSDAAKDNIRARGLMLRLFPVLITSVSMSVRNEGPNLMVKSGPGIPQNSNEVRFKRQP